MYILFYIDWRNNIKLMLQQRCCSMKTEDEFECDMTNMLYISMLRNSKAYYWNQKGNFLSLLKIQPSEK